MRFRVVVTAQAERDFGEIFAFIALENPAAARRLVDALRPAGDDQETGADRSKLGFSSFE